MSEAQGARFRLYYWPIPFRGAFVSYLFAFRDVPLAQVSSFEAIGKLKSLPPEEQGIPFMGPPVLEDLEAGLTLSQMPAIVLYVSKELDLLPEQPVDQAIAMKVLMDCNDLLMEICRYNGSMMWEREAWLEFRGKRLPHWLSVFEESLARGHFSGKQSSYADIAVFALFVNMMRCLPELESDVRDHAPGVHAHCHRIGLTPSLAAKVAQDDEEFGDLYCGGQIEASIREMLTLDAA